MARPDSAYRPLEEFTVHDLESVRLILRGGTVVDWHRLNLDARSQAEEFVRVQEMDLVREIDRRYTEAIRDESIGYLKRNFDFPVPKPVRQASLPDLLMLAAGRGHRQVCACSILKVMHIIHHLRSQELRASLPISDQQMFSLVEEKVYRVIGSMLAAGLPIIELIGGRKHRDGQYTKLLAKGDNTAARIFDKIRFRLVTRVRDDIFPVLNYLTRLLFPFNCVIPRQSTNTLFRFPSYIDDHPHLATLRGRLQLPLDLEDVHTRMENAFTDPSYQVVHFVADLPVRIDGLLEQVGIALDHPGRVIFALTEFQLVDRETDARNEAGPSSHAAYKERQRQAVERRLKLGFSLPTPPPTDEPTE